MLSRAHKSLSASARPVLGRGKHYLQRLGRWAVVLLQVRGHGWRDELKLLASAAAAPVTSLYGLSKWQDPVLLFDAVVRIRNVGTFHVRRRTDDLWHVLPWRERKVHQAFRRLLRAGDLLVDAGANIGVYTVLGSRLVGPGGRVVAIEMMPETVAILRKHVAANHCRNVEIVEGALAGQAGDIVTATVPQGRHGQASIAEHASRHSFLETRSVETTTLDEATRGLERIDLLKLDLEGAELAALSGGRSTLERSKRLICESHTGADELDRTIRRAGFDLSETMGNDRLYVRRQHKSAAKDPVD